MTSEEFDACFDRFRESAWRRETLQRYIFAGEDDRVRAWRGGQPRPERTVRASPWLRRVAVTTAAGKRWRRTHVVRHPLGDYLRFQMMGYIESAAAGEEIRIADQAAARSLANVGPDFWLFDGDSADAYAVLIRYGQDGRWLGAELTTDPGVLEKCRSNQAVAVAHSVPLNVYLAGAGADTLRRVA
jgi:Family of unknown function (DUF6879)